MDFTFTVDFDAESIYVVLDNCQRLSIVREDEGYRYSGFSKVSEVMGEKIKEISDILFSLNDEC